MPERDGYFKEWDGHWQRVENFAGALSRYAAQNVNANNLRNQAREIGRTYFQRVKPLLQKRGVTETSLANLDGGLRRLMALANGLNSRTSYRNVVRDIREQRTVIETGLEFLIGAESPPAALPADTERAILQTLEAMIPSAGASYKQVILDLQIGGRVSHRGTTAELREVVREVLDTLAPDDAVMTAAGFKLEPNRNGPTMAQKVKVYLKSAKGLRPSQGKQLRMPLQLLTTAFALLGRSVYTRGAMSVHNAPDATRGPNL